MAMATSLPAFAEPPIGIFDSGVGGLTVLSAVARTLPHEPLLYLGDTARVPYGTRSASVVRNYARRCADFLVAHGAKMVVVACNTASAFALDTLSAALSVPVVGVVEAGASAVAAAGLVGPVGVLGTEGTITSGAYQAALHRLAPAVRPVVQAAPLLVPLCEEGLFEHPATRLLAQDYLRPLLDAQVKGLLLGCTHYPLLAPLFAQLCGPGVYLIDSATAAARAVQARLEGEGLMARARQPAPMVLCASDVHPRIERIANMFLGGGAVPVVPVDL